MSQLVFMVEERSMKELLLTLLPRLFPTLDFLCIPHEGKQDLEKSFPRKLRAWGVPGDRFVVVRDKDSDDCISLKARLQAICREKGGKDDVLVRIVCHELEAWYLGEPDALAEAFETGSLRKRLTRFSNNADEVRHPSRKLEDLVPEFQKISGARVMGKFMTRERNASHSFQVFLAGIDRLIREMDIENPA